ncbi:BTB/POZ protein [Xylaria cf. heliscus]|nr:BTB/POZ protein [Xylaria cf. heliscus]
MENLLANLLSSGDYSDLTLLCEDQEFRVHKNIVCSQSPVLAAAFKGGFQESKTNEFHVVDFSPTTLKCMIDYMYTRGYKKMPDGCRNDGKDQAQTTNNDKHTSTKIAETWIYHGRVNCIADYFCLPELAKMATTTLDRLTKENWSEDAFCDLLDEIHGKTGDNGFRDMLAQRATDHISELTARGLFNGADPPSDELVPTVLRLCGQRIDASQKRIDALQASLFPESKWPRMM